MTDKPLGIDVSRWQGEINFTKMKAQGVRWVYLRSGISWGYKDPWFDEYRLRCEDVGLPWGVYHPIYCGQGAQRQVDNMLRIINGNWGQLPAAPDMETDLNQNRTVVTSELLQILSLIEKEHGKQPIIYSRTTWIEQYTLPGTWRNQYDWWLAQYLFSGEEHQGPPTLPKGVTRDKVVIHQTSDRGDGSYYGVQSKAVDLNRWQLSEAELLTFIGQEVEPEPEPEPPTFEQVVIYKLNQIMKAVGAK